IAIDTVRIEHRDWDRIGNRGGIAEIDERMNGWKAAVLSEPAQQCLGRASILGWLQAHRSKSCPPGADLRKSSFGHRRDPVGGLCQKRSGARGHLRPVMNSADADDAGDACGKAFLHVWVIGKLHAPLRSVASS